MLKYSCPLLYHKIPSIKEQLEKAGHIIALPNSYDAPFKAFELGKKIFFYNPLPEGIFNDELIAFNPVILNTDLTKII